MKCRFPAAYVLLLLILLGSHPSTGASLFKRAPDYRFAVLGGVEAEFESYAETLNGLAAVQPDFAFNLGKMLTEPGNPAQWTDFFQLSRKISVPYYLVPSPGEVVDEETEHLYKEWVELPGNELYYSFTYGTSHFIVLDGEEPGSAGKIAGRQYDWLREELQWNRTFDHIFVFLHRSLFPKHASLDRSLARFPPEREALHELFRWARVDAVFHSEGNYVSSSTHDGVFYINTGAAGASPEVPVTYGGYRHFLLVEVRGKKVTVKVMSPEGMPREEIRLRKPPAKDKSRKQY